MFLGEYTHNIDDKGRLTIPAKYRSDLAAGLVVTRGFDQNLVVYPLSGWQKLAERILRKPLSDQHVRQFRRLVFSGATDLTPDRQGRILVPAFLRDYAAITTEAVIVGMFDHLEVWNTEAWKTQRDLIDSHAGDERWAALDI